MKISELVKALEGIRERCGDVAVAFEGIKEGAPICAEGDSTDLYIKAIHESYHTNRPGAIAMITLEID